MKLDHNKVLLYGIVLLLIALAAMQWHYRGQVADLRRDIVNLRRAQVDSLRAELEAIARNRVDSTIIIHRTIDNTQREAAREQEGLIRVHNLDSLIGHYTRHRPNLRHR